MDTWETKTKRCLRPIGLLVLLLVGSGCIQTRAPIEAPRGNPPPRAVYQAPALQTPPAAVRPAPQAPVAAPQQNNPPQLPVAKAPTPPAARDLPPPNLNPVVSDVGQSSAPKTTPIPAQTPSLPAERTTKPPKQAVAETNFGSEDTASAQAPKYPVRPKKPEVSDDYATIFEASPDANPTLTPDAPEPYDPLAEAAETDDPAQILTENQPIEPKEPEQNIVPSEEEQPRYASWQQDPNAQPSGPVLPQPQGQSGAGAAPSGPSLVALLIPENHPAPAVRGIAKDLAQAAALAVSDLNDPRLILKKYDTGSDPRKAALAAQTAIADGARLIIGPLFSASAVAVRPVAQAANVEVIAFTTDQSVLGAGLYSIAFLLQSDINRIVSYAARRGLKKIALLTPNSPYGKVVTEGTKQVANRFGTEIVANQVFNSSFKEANSAATKFAEFYKANPDIDGVLIAASGQPLQTLASFMSYNDVLSTKVKFMGLGGWDDPETFREATLRKGWFPGIDPALKADFNYRYGQLYGTKPQSVALLGYDAVSVAAGMLNASRGGNPFTREALLSPAGFRGMSGLFRFRPDGRNDRALSILEVTRQEFRVIERAPTQFPSLAGG